jgi:hypothetical protein
MTNNFSGNLAGMLKVEHPEIQHDNNKALTRPPMLYMAHPVVMDHDEHGNPLENFNMNRTPRQKGFYMGYSDFHFPETAGDFHGNEMVDYPNNMHHTNEFDPFSDMMSALQPKHPKNEETFHDPSAFFYPKGFNAGYNYEGMEDNMENAGNGPLKGFMDTQKLLQEALRKGNFWNHSGNQNFRKSSFDLF